MGLRDVIASLITVADNVTKDLQPTVQHRAWRGQDVRGKADLAPAVPYQALVEKINRRMVTPNGVEQHVNYYVAIIGPVAATSAPDRQNPVDTRDVFIMPDGATGPIVDYRGLLDSYTNAPYLSEVWLG